MRGVFGGGKLDSLTVWLGVGGLYSAIFIFYVYGTISLLGLTQTRRKVRLDSNRYSKNEN